MDYITLFKKFYDVISVFLSEFYNWYIIIFIYAFIYFLFQLYVNNFVGREMRKRREIMQDIHLYKTTHPNELYPAASEKQMKNILHLNQPNYPESYYDGLEQIVQKWKGRPLLAFCLVISQYWIFLSLLAYHMLLHSRILDIEALYYINMAVMAVLMFSKRLLWLKIIFFLVALFAYHFFTPEALLFTGIISILKLINKIYINLRLRSYQNQKKRISESK